LNKPYDGIIFITARLAVVELNGDSWKISKNSLGRRLVLWFSWDVLLYDIDRFYVIQMQNWTANTVV